ncbi:MAG: hypothetical protein J5713_03205 [Clostridia bacterium]|nr:hypothetical protein [Clostridia bacterium]
MERYFLGNNTAFGFFGNYEDELKDKNKVILLKGGPGTGKSTMLKRLAKEAETRGFDVELWYCSGDPKSLDGVCIKDLNVAVVDATAPHATGADLPIIKDVIFDLATSLQRDKLAPCIEEIKKLVNCKKHRFMRAYQHLNLAFCHLQNQIALEQSGVDKAKIRRIAIETASGFRGEKGRMRNLFVEAICPEGESVFYDFLKGKQIVKVKGGEVATQTFFDELKGLVGGTYILNPLDSNRLDGIILKDVAIVKDAGTYEEKIARVIDLSEFEKFEYPDEILEERNGVVLEEAFAVEELNRAREFHLELEKYFVAAMDFSNNNRLYDEIVEACFG